MGKIAEAANDGDQAKVVDLITQNSFDDRPQAQDLVLTVFEIEKSTDDKFRLAAQKVSGWPVDERWSWRSRMRHELIKNAIS